MDSPTDLVGRTLAGNIRVREKIGETAQGGVYRAEEAHTGLELELLTLRYVSSWSRYPGQADDIDHLWQQLSRAHRIDHPNIAKVKALGVTADGTRFVALEVLQGELLSDVLSARSALPIEEATELIRQAALGLQAAHSEAVLHGGISPETILVTLGPDDRPRPKLIRFGWRVRSDYTAPEELAGSPGVQRSDIYSLGAVLHHLLTGEPPTADRTKLEQLPEAIRAVVSRALEPIRERRFATAGAFADALGIARQAVLAEKEQEPRWRARLVMGAAGLAGMAVVIWLLVHPGEPRAEPAAARATMAGVSVPPAPDSTPEPPTASAAPRSLAPRPGRDRGRATAPPSRELASAGSRRPRAATPPAAVSRAPARESVLGYAPEAPGPPATLADPPTTGSPGRSRVPEGRAVEPPAPEESPLNEIPALKLALGDVLRLGIATSYTERSFGHLVLTVGEGYHTSSSVDYNLSRLYAAYFKSLGYPKVAPVLELWRDGKKIGEFTRAGLQEQSGPGTGGGDPPGR